MSAKGGNHRAKVAAGLEKRDCRTVGMTGRVRKKISSNGVSPRAAWSRIEPAPAVPAVIEGPNQGQIADRLLADRADATTQRNAAQVVVAVVCVSRDVVRDVVLVPRGRWIVGAGQTGTAAQIELQAGGQVGAGPDGWARGRGQGAGGGLGLGRDAAIAMGPGERGVQVKGRMTPGSVNGSWRIQNLFLVAWFDFVKKTAPAMRWARSGQDFSGLTEKGGEDFSNGGWSTGKRLFGEAISSAGAGGAPSVATFNTQ